MEQVDEEAKSLTQQSADTTEPPKPRPPQAPDADVNPIKGPEVPSAVERDDLADVTPSPVEHDDPTPETDGPPPTTRSDVDPAPSAQPEPEALDQGEQVFRDEGSKNRTDSDAVSSDQAPPPWVEQAPRGSETSDLHEQVTDRRFELDQEDVKEDTYEEEEFVPDRDPLPSVNAMAIAPLYDARQGACQGYLYKKGGSKGGGLFNRRNWSKRLFVIELQIDDTQNYTLKYYKDGDAKAKGELSLEGTVLDMVAGEHSSSKVGYEFQLVGTRNSVFELYAEKEEERDTWLRVLAHVVEVANARGSAMRQRGIKLTRGENKAASARISSGGGMGDLASDDMSVYSSRDKKRGRFLGGKKKNKSAGLKKEAAKVENKGLGAGGSAFAAARAGANPLTKITGGRESTPNTLSLRLDVDLDTIPPDTLERKEFVAKFQLDVSRVCEVPAECVLVTELVLAPSMDWMTLVEFQLLQVDEYDAPTLRHLPLSRLRAALSDANSPLFQGHVTCNVDPSFASGLEHTDGSIVKAVLSKAASPDPTVQQIFQKYATTEVHDDAVQAACFNITLVWHTTKKDMLVVNPRLVHRNACLVFPHDIKRALGISGTLSETWLEPTALEPLGLHPDLAAPLRFVPSVRSHGIPVIDAMLLKAGLKYKVNVEDRRQDAVERLTEQERRHILEVFQSFDADKNGDISMAEALAHAKLRTTAKIEAVRAQFDYYVQARKRTPGEIDAKRETMHAHISKLQDSEKKLLAIISNADINQDGSLSFQEFVLAEAWWMRSNLNPERVMLFET